MGAQSFPGRMGAVYSWLSHPRSHTLCTRHPPIGTSGPTELVVDLAEALGAEAAGAAGLPAGPTPGAAGEAAGAGAAGAAGLPCSRAREMEKLGNL